jgi:hypothetical protein
MELIVGLEPTTSSLPRKCSTSEPYEHKLMAKVELNKFNIHKQLFGNLKLATVIKNNTYSSQF